MILFMRIMLLLMLKNALLDKSTESGASNLSSAWTIPVPAHNALFVEANGPVIDQVVNLCAVYGPIDIEREPDQAYEPGTPVRINIYFKNMVPDIQKQIAQRLSQQFTGNLSFKWYSHL